MMPAGKNHTDTVHALLTQGADVNAKDKLGFTALRLAKEKEHKEIVRILKEVGAKE
jgi:ankyrin repeat protein